VSMEDVSFQSPLVGPRHIKKLLDIPGWPLHTYPHRVAKGPHFEA